MYWNAEPTRKELEQMYQGLSKRVLIEMLINNNELVDQLLKERECDMVYGVCEHEWIICRAGLERCRLCGISRLACMGEEMAGW